MKETAARKKLNLSTPDRYVAVSLLVLLAATVVLLIMKSAHLLLKRGEILLFLPFLLAFILLGWGVSAIVRKLKRPAIKLALGVALSVVLVFLALMVFSYVGFVATITIPQPYNNVASPSGAHRLVVLRGLDDDEARLESRRAARLEADPEGDPEIIADDWCYRFTAYPSAGRFFYRNNADVEGQVTIAYSGGGTLMVEWSEDESEAHFFVQDPAVGEGGDLYVRF